MIEPAYEKILIRGVNWIGDAVMTMPAIKAIRQCKPNVLLHLLVRPFVAPLFENNPNINDLILYKDYHKGVIGRLRLARLIKKRVFTKAILFQNAFDAALIAFLSRIPERIGYSRDGRGFLLTTSIPYKSEDRRIHHIDYYLNLLNAAGIPAKFSQPWIYLSLAERLGAREKLSRLRRPILGINPGATYGSTKRWFPERFAEVAKWFIQDTKGSVVIFGGKNETAICNEVDKRLPPFVREQDVESFTLLNMAGKTELRELIALISECDLLLTNDSGPMHIGYAVGTPLVALFGSTDPLLTGPVGEGTVVIWSQAACSPCFSRSCNSAYPMRCMYDITSEDVFHRLKSILSKRRAVFFDRDGTLCRDADYLRNWDDFEVFHDIEHVRKLKEQDLFIVGVSNQSGIGRGIVDEAFAKEVNRVFVERYGFDDFLYCPHMPDDHCHCRKPEPGLAIAARAQHSIDLKRSYVVGDKEADMLFAKTIGAKSILVLTGQHKESGYADHIVKNLAEAVELIIRHG